MKKTLPTENLAFSATFVLTAFTQRRALSVYHIIIVTTVGWILPVLEGPLMFTIFPTITIIFRAVGGRVLPEQAFDRFQQCDFVSIQLLLSRIFNGVLGVLLWIRMDMFDGDELSKIRSALIQHISFSLDGKSWSSTYSSEDSLYLSILFAWSTGVSPYLCGFGGGGAVGRPSMLIVRFPGGHCPLPSSSCLYWRPTWRT